MTSAAHLPAKEGQDSNNNSVTLTFTPEAVAQLKALTGENDTRNALNKVVETVAYLKRRAKKSRILIENQDGSVESISFNN